MRRKPKTLKELPDAWLHFYKHPFTPGVFRADSFASLPEAEACKRKARYGRVGKDSPELRLSVDGIRIWKPQHITMRENWLKRNSDFVKPCLSDEREAVVFTWEEGSLKDVLAARLGGCAPLLKEEEWPYCESCQEPRTYIGTLDFRCTPLRSAVPGDALTYFQCLNENCPDWLHNFGAACAWLYSGEKIVLKTPPQGIKGKTYTGTSWLVKDYTIENTEWFMEEEKELEKQFDLNLIGASPYFCLSANAIKIGGHPYWIQQDESVHSLCQCGQPMNFIGQFIEYDEIEFGDCGIAYILACAQNKCDDFDVIVQCF